MAGQVYPYQYLADDLGLAKVAQRYRTTPAEIWKTTQASGKFTGMPMSALQWDDLIYISLPADDPDEVHVWKPLLPEAISLKALCDDFNKKTAAGALKLDPFDLWFNIRNAAFRARHIKKGEHGPDTASFDIKDKTDSILLPYRKTSVPTISVAPSDTVANTVTVKKKPMYVMVIEDAIEDIKVKTAKLLALNKIDRDLRVECARDCAILNALRVYADVLRDSGTLTLDVVDSLNAIKEKLAKVDAYAAEHMLVNPSKIIHHADESEKQTAAKALYDATRDALLYKSALEMKRTGGDSGLAVPLDLVFAEAFEALCNSHEASKAGDEIDIALSSVPTSAKPLPDPPTTLAVLASIGTVVVAATPSVESTNLIVTLMTLRAIQLAPELVADPVKAAAFTDKYLTLLKVRPKAADGKNLSPEEAIDLTRMIDSGEMSALKVWDESLFARYSTVGFRTLGVNVAFSLCGFLSLLQCIKTAKDETVRLRLWANAAGGAATMAPAVARTSFELLKTFRLGGKAALRLEDAMGGETGSMIGVFGAICGLISGSISAVEAYEAHDGLNLVLDFEQILGSGFTIAAVFCESAELAATLGLAGVLVGIGTAAVVGAMYLNDKMREGTERVFTARLQQFKSSYNVKPFLNDVPGFAAALDDLIGYVRDHATFREMPDSKENRAAITRLGFTDDEAAYSVGAK